MRFIRVFSGFVWLSLFLVCSVSALAESSNCVALPSHEALRKALTNARQKDNGGLNLDMWATVVDRSGVVCAVAYTGATPDAQWPASRVISAQKANTANGFSLPGLSIASANLFYGTQPSGFLFGLQESNPVDTAVAYAGSGSEFGSSKDPMLGKRIGGINVFGGGLALYDAKGKIVGGLGVSGDTSCADHNIAWNTRHNLGLDFVPAGVAPTKNDQIIYDITAGLSSSGYGHPTCSGKEDDIAATLPATQNPPNN
jgi:uncharacterized protein GlcG (DUF336 family)